MKIDKHRILYIFPFIFIISLMFVLIFSFASKPRVLIVMSYSEHDLWEKQIRLAMDKTFREKAPYFSINYYYLNIRDNNIPSYIARVTKEVNDLISEWRPQVLLLVDDDAQNYVGKNYLYNSKYNIVFAGVNADPSIYGYAPHLNMTGIIENLHFKAMKSAIAEIFPSYHKIIHICDDTTTSKYVSEKISENDWSPIELVESHKTNSIVDWDKAVERANELNAIILLSHFQTLRLDTKLIPPADVVQLTLQKAKVPVIGFFNFNVILGVPLAISTSGLEQGEVAANITIRILHDKVKIADIPFSKSQHFDFSYNQDGMNKNMPGLILPPIYSSFSYLKMMLETPEYLKQSNP